MIDNRSEENMQRNLGFKVQGSMFRGQEQLDHKVSKLKI